MQMPMALRPVMAEYHRLRPLRQSAIQYLEAAASSPICEAETMRMRKAKLFTRATHVSIRTQLAPATI